MKKQSVSRPTFHVKSFRTCDVGLGTVFSEQSLMPLMAHPDKTVERIWAENAKIAENLH
jgi:hypothetical protein